MDRPTDSQFTACSGWMDGKRKIQTDSLWHAMNEWTVEDKVKNRQTDKQIDSLRHVVDGQFETDR